MITMKLTQAAILSVAVAGLACLSSTGATAAEQGQSFYLLGSKGSMAGMIPPPGTYLADLNYYYTGSASGHAALGITARRTGSRDTNGIPLLVEADISVDGKAYYQIPTAIWVLPGQIAGGNLGFSFALPMGWKQVAFDIDARATLTLPPPINRTIQVGRRYAETDSDTNIGDAIASSFIGWHQGAWHWNVGTMVNIPIGAWETGKLANTGFNHWAIDTTASATWLDPRIGLELSAAAGFTFNFENPDSNYQSGTDFHVEIAAMRHVSPRLAFGLAGYHYQQVTGDSGAGAILGDFKGRVSALGPAVNYTFQIGHVPVSTKLNWYHEFNEQNRLKGNAGLFSVVIPLGGPPPGQGPAPLK